MNEQYTSASGDDDWAKLSVEERFEHKSWKARLSAFEELGKAVSGASPKHRDFVEFARRSVNETNAAAQEAAFSFLTSFLESCPHEAAVKLRPSILQGIIEKGLTAAKAGTRQRAIACLSALIAHDTSAEPVITELANIAMASVKQPKLLTAILQCIHELMRAFGATVIVGGKLNTIICSLLSVSFQHADKTVRQESHDIVVESSRWGCNINTIAGLKPVQVKELTDAMAVHMNTARPSATRWLRGQQPAVAECNTDTTDADVVMAATATGTTTDTPSDEFETAIPVNILERLPANFTDFVESAKWKERKEVLDALLPLVKVPRLEEGRYGELVGVLVKRVADVNILVAITAANCLEGMARGLRAAFASYRGDVIPALLDRCKEKKGNVVQAMKEALKATLYSINSISDILSDISPLLQQKNPQIRQEALTFAAMVMNAKTSRPCQRKDLKDLADLIASGLDHADSAVRDAAAEAMAALLKSVGEKNVLPYLDSVDKSKLVRIREMANGAVPALVPAPVPVPMVPAKRPIERERPTNSISAVKSEKPTNIKNDDFDHVPSTVSQSAAIDTIAAVVGEAVVENLSSAAWKERVEAMEVIVNNAHKFSSEQLVRLFTVKPNWQKESNFLVYGKTLTALLLVPTPWSREAVAVLVAEGGVAEKLSDAKLQRDTTAVLCKCAESVSLGFLLHHLLQWSKTNLKSPKALADLFKFTSQALLEFGTVSLRVPDLVSFLKTNGLQNPNPMVRQSAVQVASGLYSFLGEGVKQMFGDQSAAIQSVLEAEFAKAVVVGSTVPKRTVMVADEAVMVPQETITVAKEKPQDIVPRLDLSQQVVPVLVKLADANWKVRKEGLDELEQAFTNGGKFSVDSSTQLDLFSALKSRFNDTNKNLAIQALEFAGKCAQLLSSDKAGQQAVKLMCQSAMHCLSDPKPQVRAAAIKCLDDMLVIMPASVLIGTAGQTIASVESPNLRKELLTWLCRPMSGHSLTESADETAIILSAIVLGLQDRSGDVRKAAQQLLPVLTPSDLVLRHVQRSAPSLLPTVQPLLAQPGKPSINPGKTPVKKTADSTNSLFLDSAPSNRTALKWPFDGQGAPRRDLQEQLEQQCRLVFTSSACKVLFSSDLPRGLLERAIEDNLSCVDLILRLLTIRLFDGNNQRQKCLDVLEQCLSAMDRANVRMAESDAVAFLPYFVHCLGEWRGEGGPHGQRVKQVLRVLCRVYPASKLFNHLCEWGLAPSAGKATRQETLTELSVLLSRNGASVIAVNKHISMIAACLMDPHVKSQAGKVMAQVARLVGLEHVYKQVVDGVIGQREYDHVVELINTDCAGDTKCDDNDQDGEQVAEEQPPPTPLLHDINPFAPNQPNQDTTPTIPLIRPRTGPTTTISSTHLTINPLDTEIELIGCASDAQCIQALQRLDDPLNKPTVEMMERVDQLVMALAVRLRAITRQPDLPSMPPSGQSRLCRYVCNALVLLVSNPESVKLVQEETLECLLSACLQALLSPCINDHFSDDRDQLLKALNVMLVKAMEGCHQNMCYRVLLNLLSSAFLPHDKAVDSEKYPELVMKCLWKETKSLPAMIEQHRINIGELMVDIDRFLKVIPPIEWKTRAAQKMAFEDLPLRTVKTIILEICTLLGNDAAVIKSHLQVLDEEDSFVVSYCRQFVEAAGREWEPKPATSSSGPEQLSEADLEVRLKTICDCICSKPDTRMVHHLYADTNIVGTTGAARIVHAPLVVRSRPNQVLHRLPGSLLPALH